MSPDRGKAVRSVRPWHAEVAVRSPRSRAAGWALLLTVLAACGQPDREAPALATDAEALTSVVCRAGALPEPNAAAPACRGPWAFRNVCPTSAKNPACGVATQDTCYKYYCRSSAFGVESYYTAAEKSATVTLNGTEYWSRECSGYRACDAWQVTVRYTKTLEAYSSEARINEVNAGRQYNPTPITENRSWGAVTYTSTSATTCYSDPEFGGSTCSYTRKFNQPGTYSLNNVVKEWKEGEVPAGTTSCAVRTEAYACNQTYLACRAATNPPEALPETCDGLTAQAQGEARSLDQLGPQYSRAGLTLAQVADENTAEDLRIGVWNAQTGAAAECTTGDDIPLDKPAERYDRLMKYLRMVEADELPVSVDRVALYKLLSDDLKALVERYGDKLTASQRQAVGRLYVPRPTSQRLTTNRQTRLDPVLSWDWAGGAPRQGMGADVFSARWTGFVRIPVAGSYRFAGASDDGVRLTVGSTSVESWIDRGYTPSYTPFATYAAGAYVPVRYEYYENGGWAAARLLMESSTGAQLTPELYPPHPAFPTVADTTRRGLKAEYFNATRELAPAYVDDTLLGSDACVGGWQPPVGPGASTTTDDLNGRLALCRSVATATHAGVAVATAVLDECGAIGVGTSYEATYAAAVREVLKGLMDRVFESGALPSATPEAPKAGLAALRTWLRAVDRWYRLGQPAAPPATGGGDPTAMVAAGTQSVLLPPPPPDDPILVDPVPPAPPTEARWAETNAMVRDFWKAVHARRLVLTGANNAVLPADFEAKLTQSQLDSDREVLQALFPESADGSAPLTSAPLVMVASDALQAVALRLQNAGAAQDFACRLKGCASGVTTPVVQMWSLMAQLHGGPALTSALGSAGLVDGGWKKVFENLAGRQHELALAVAEAVGAVPPTDEAAFLERVLAADGLPSVHFTTRPLAAMVRMARDRGLNFKLSGLLESEGRREVHEGLQRSMEEAVILELPGQTQALDKAITDYDTKRTKLVQDLLAERDNTDKIAGIQARLKVMDTRYRQASTDLSALRHLLATTEVRWGRFVASLTEATAAAVQDGHLVPASEHPEHVFVNAVSGRRFSQPKATDGDNLLSFAAFSTNGYGGAWTGEASARDMVVVGVDGVYSPTCALRTHAALEKVGPVTDGRVQVGDALVGPEGFMMRIEDTKFVARRHDTVNSSSQFNTESDSDTTCWHFGGGVNIPIIGQVGGASWDACHKLEIGQTDSWSVSDSSSRGSESRVASSFVGGMRLDTTPFPDFPVGSLLLVQLRDGSLADGVASRSEVANVQVLRSPRTTVMPRENVEFLLVVNDSGYLCDAPLTDEQRAWESEELDVSIQRFYGAGQWMPKVLEAVDYTRDALDPEVAQMMAKGRLTAQDLASLRTEAMDALGLKLGATLLASLPATVRSAYNAWFEHYLVTVERRFDVISTLRTQQVAEMEMDALSGEIARSQQQARLLRLLPEWTLANVTGRYFEDSEKNLLDLLNKELYPIIALRYPKMLASFVGGQATNLDALIDESWTATPLEQARRVHDVANALYAPLSAAARMTPGLDGIGAVYFPRPGATQPTYGFTPPGKDLPVESKRVQDVWAHLLDPTLGPVSFDVEFNDLYTNSNTEIAGQLLCNRGTPIIQSMALFIVGKDIASPETWNDNEVTLEAGVSPQMRFPLLTAYDTYQHRNPSWLNPGIRVLVGPRENAIGTFRDLKYDLMLGSGLSPFTSVDVNAMGLAGQWTREGEDDPTHALEEAVGVMLMFKVQTTLVDNKMTWIGACK